MCSTFSDSCQEALPAKYMLAVRGPHGRFEHLLAHGTVEIILVETLRGGFPGHGQAPGPLSAERGPGASPPPPRAPPAGPPEDGGRAPGARWAAGEPKGPGTARLGTARLGTARARLGKRRRRPSALPPRPPASLLPAAARGALPPPPRSLRAAQPRLARPGSMLRPGPAAAATASPGGQGRDRGLGRA